MGEKLSMLNLRIVRSVFIFSSFCMTLSSCHQRTSIVPDNPECSPPCWNGITPGVTSPANAYSKMNSYCENNPARREFDITDGYWSCGFESGYLESGGRIYFNDHHVYGIDLPFDKPLAMSQMIEIYGEPQFGSFISGWADSKWMLYTFLYPDQGIALTSFDGWFWPDRDDIELGRTFKVEDIYFFEPGLLFDEDTLRRLFLIAGDESTVRESLQIWQGYGRYQYIDDEGR